MADLAVGVAGGSARVPLPFASSDRGNGHDISKGRAGFGPCDDFLWRDQSQRPKWQRLRRTKIIRRGGHCSSRRSPRGALFTRRACQSAFAARAGSLKDSPCVVGRFWRWVGKPVSGGVPRMDAYAPGSLLAHLAHVPDPRSPHGQRFALPALLAAACAAILCGARPSRPSPSGAATRTSA